MDPVTVTATTSAPLSPGVGVDIFSLILGLFSGSESTASFFSANGFIGFLDAVWSVYIVFAYIISIVLLTLYAYASSRRWQYYDMGDKELRDFEELYDAQYRGIQKTTRLGDVLAHTASSNPNDWKLAIIEADIILDDILKQRGYVGTSLGERLKGVAPGQLDTINDAWEAHKIRNRIAHDGADFVLTQRLAEETINRYRRVFNEFGVS